MSTSTIRSVIAGGFVGVALTFTGLWIAPARTQAPVPPPIVVDQRTPTAWWLDPSEIQLGPAVMLVDELVVEGDEAVLRFETFSIAPTALGRYRDNAEIGNRFFATPEDPVIAPEIWTLETTNGPIEGRTTGARVQTARFPIDDTFSMSQVTGLRLDRWRMRVPYVYRFELDTTSTRPVHLDEGLTVVTGRVIPQSGSIIVQIDLETPSDLFTAGEAAAVRIAGVGPEWISSGSRAGGAQLVRTGDAIPDVIELEAQTAYYVAFDRPITIDLDRVTR